MLELVERLADLHIKRDRLRATEEAGQRLLGTRPELRNTFRTYRKAVKVLTLEIRAVEDQLERAFAEQERNPPRG